MGDPLNVFVRGYFMIHFLINQGTTIAITLNIIAIIAIIFAQFELRKALRLMDSSRDSRLSRDSASFTANQEEATL